MRLFFFSVASGSQKRAVEEIGYPYVLVNFMTEKNKPPSCARVLFVDSGGFHSSLNSNRYTKTDEEYFRFVAETGAEFFALRDYPCEPQILEKHGLTVKDQISRTLEHHIKLLDMLDEYGVQAEPVSVLQGWEVEDYMFCIDVFREHGLIDGYVGIGSLCRRNATSQIRKIILAVRDELKDSVKIHCFGTKLSVLNDIAVWRAIFSADSGAWDIHARWQYYYEGNYESRHEATVSVARKYLEKIERLRRKFEGQTVLCPL